jgi:hypothetical protein
LIPAELPRRSPPSIDTHLVDDGSIFRTFEKALLGIHREPALPFHVGLTPNAVLLQDRHHFMHEIRFRQQGASQGGSKYKLRH